MTTVYNDEKMNDDDRRQRLYNGDIFVYSPSPGTEALCKVARELCEDAFGPYHPTEAQYELPVETYVEILAKLKPTFIHHPDSKIAIQQILRDLQCDCESTYFDVPRLRTSTSDGYLTSGLAYVFKPHRDTWYSPPMCQLNWWIPIYEVESDNVMAFHLHYWDNALKNSSNEFNYQEWVKTGRKNASQHVKQDTRRQSEALEEVQLDPQLRIICPPAGMIIFSAAHLHSSVPNTSGKTRISADFRTVHRGDLLEDRGAPNMDSQCSGTTVMDYLRGTGLVHFEDEIVDKVAKR